jgi:hypothetical protein
MPVKPELGSYRNNMKKSLKSYTFAGICVLIFAIAIFSPPVSFWVHILNLSEKLIFQKAISHNRLDVPESWFELRQDKFDASIPESVIKDFQNAILDYLNADGNIEQLKNELSTIPGVLHIDIQLVDFSDDTSQELIVAIEFLRRGRHASFIWVIGKIDGLYTVLFQTSDNDWLLYDPRIILVNDINNDGLKEVIASIMWIGSEKEIRFYVLAQYSPSQYVTTLFASTIVPLGNVETSISDIDGDKVKEITLTGYRWHNSSHEKIAYEYKWDGNRYDLFREYNP